MALLYRPMTKFYRLPATYALTLPFTALMYSAMTAHSAWRYWRGRGGQWKGRTYAAQ